MSKNKVNFSAMDVHEVKFRRSFRGYHENDIDDFIDKVTEDYVTLNKEIELLRDKVDKLKKGYR